MSASDDDDDKFLYGSDEDNSVKNAKRSNDTLNVNDNKNGNKKAKTEINNTAKSDESEEDSNSEYSDEESDSDVEFIISTGTDDASKLDSNQQPGTITVASEGDINKVGQSGDTKVGGNGAAINDEGTTDSTARKMEASAIDINGEGMYEGEPISSISPEVLKEKPWRQPGANLSDYFNYGFNEYTWMEYLQKQEKLKQEYNPHKILMGLMTLQQQGKLIVPQQKPNDQSSSATPGTLPTPNNNNNMNMNMNMNMKMDMSKMQNSTGNNPPVPPPGFPMFGGFTPFPMPHMLPQMPNGQFPPIPDPQQQNSNSPQKN